MLPFIRVFLAILVILLIVPQTPKENSLLRMFHETGLFATYGDAKQFLNRLTAASIFLFLFLTIVS